MKDYSQSFVASHVHDIRVDVAEASRLRFVPSRPATSRMSADGFERSELTGWLHGLPSSTTSSRGNWYHRSLNGVSYHPRCLHSPASPRIDCTGPAWHPEGQRSGYLHWPDSSLNSLAPRRSAPRRDAPLRSAPERSALWRVVSRRSAFSRQLCINRASAISTPESPHSRRLLPRRDHPRTETSDGMVVRGNRHWSRSTSLASSLTSGCEQRVSCGFVPLPPACQKQ